MDFYICFSEILRKTQEKINNSYTKTMAFYRKSGSECTMEQLSKGTPTLVSIATMLEWISDLNQLFHELYPCKGKWKFIKQPLVLFEINYFWVSFKLPECENFRLTHPKIER